MLPPCTQGYFTFNVTTSIPHGEYSFVSCSLPFGWSWSPYIAQNTVESILRPITYLLPMIWVYVDDVLLAHSDPVFLTYVVYYAVHLLECAGFIISTKSVTVPTTIQWLGKTVSINGISNTFGRLAQLFLSIWLLRTRHAVFVQSSGYWVLSSGSLLLYQLLGRE